MAAPITFNQTKQTLLATYRDDFNKYAAKLPVVRLEEIMQAVPRFLGEKFIYSRVTQEAKSSTVNTALNLLEKARLVSRVMATHANGIPLGAELNERYFKVLFIDVGLANAQLGINSLQLKQTDDMNLINQDGISEQLVGQLLRTFSPFYVEPRLFYWVRSEKSGGAEIDYILQNNLDIIPIEVKSGSTGSLKSLHYFMSKKESPYAIRINADVPSRTQVSLKTNTGEAVNYELLSIPFYLIEQLPRIMAKN